MHVPLDYVLQRIWSGEVVKGSIEKIRAEPDPEKRQGLKKALLPAIRFAGTFKGQMDIDCMEHSGLICLDFDHLPNVTKRKEELKAFPFIYAAFISPSGDGIKALARIPADVKTHRGFFNGLRDIMPDIDKSGINLARVCYESYDPDIYVNPNATVFDVCTLAFKLRSAVFSYLNTSNTVALGLT